jgi:hypothetical protein
MAVKFTYSTRPKVFVAVGLIDQQSDNGEASAFRYMLFETRSQLKVNLMSVPWYYSSVEQNAVHGFGGAQIRIGHLSVVFSKHLVSSMPSCELTHQ